MSIIFSIFVLLSFADSVGLQEYYMNIEKWIKDNKKNYDEKMISDYVKDAYSHFNSSLLSFKSQNRIDQKEFNSLKKGLDEHFGPNHKIGNFTDFENSLSKWGEIEDQDSQCFCKNSEFCHPFTKQCILPLKLGSECSPKNSICENESSCRLIPQCKGRNQKFRCQKSTCKEIGDLVQEGEACCEGLTPILNRCQYDCAPPPQVKFKWPFSFFNEAHAKEIFCEDVKLPERCLYKDNALKKCQKTWNELYPNENILLQLEGLSFLAQGNEYSDNVQIRSLDHYILDLPEDIVAVERSPICKCEKTAQDFCSNIFSNDSCNEKNSLVLSKQSEVKSNDNFLILAGNHVSSLRRSLQRRACQKINELNRECLEVYCKVQSPHQQALNQFDEQLKLEKLKLLSFANEQIFTLIAPKFDHYFKELFSPKKSLNEAKCAFQKWTVGLQDESNRNFFDLGKLSGNKERHHFFNNLKSKFDKRNKELFFDYAKIWNDIHKDHYLSNYEELQLQECRPHYRCEQKNWEVGLHHYGKLECAGIFPLSNSCGLPLSEKYCVNKVFRFKDTNESYLLVDPILPSSLLMPELSIGVPLLPAFLDGQDDTRPYSLRLQQFLTPFKGLEISKSLPLLELNLDHGKYPFKDIFITKMSLFLFENRVFPYQDKIQRYALAELSFDLHLKNAYLAYDHSPKNHSGEMFNYLSYFIEYFSHHYQNALTKEEVVPILAYEDSMTFYKNLSKIHAKKRDLNFELESYKKKWSALLIEKEDYYVEIEKFLQSEQAKNKVPLKEELTEVIETPTPKSEDWKIDVSLDGPALPLTELLGVTDRESYEIFLAQVKDHLKLTQEYDNLFTVVGKAYIRLGIPKLLPEKGAVTNQSMPLNEKAQNSAPEIGN